MTVEWNLENPPVSCRNTQRSLFEIECLSGGVIPQNIRTTVYGNWESPKENIYF